MDRTNHKHRKDEDNTSRELYGVFHTLRQHLKDYPPFKRKPNVYSCIGQESVL